MAKRWACWRSATTETGSSARSKRARDARVHARDIGMIVAHGNGTAQSDATEAAALRHRVRRSMPTGDRIQVGVGTSDRRGRHPGNDARACCDSQANRARHRDARFDCARMYGCAAVANGATPAQRHRAHRVSRLRRNGCRAGRSRGFRLTAAAPAPSDAFDEPIRCGIDSVEIARIERLLAETPADELAQAVLGERDRRQRGRRRPRGKPCRPLRSEGGLRKAVSARAAAGRVAPADFSVVRDGYGAPRIECNANARKVLDHARIADIAVSLTHDRTRASAVALALPMSTAVPLAGTLLFGLLPFRRRVVIDNLRRVFGSAVPEAELTRLAKAHYAHLGKLVAEFVRFRFLSASTKREQVRVENVELLVSALQRGEGVLILTGHFGNWEVATVAGIRELSRGPRPLPFRSPTDQAALAGCARHAAIQPLRFRRHRETRLARRDRLAARARRRRRVPVRSICRWRRRHRRRVLRPAGGHVQEPRGDRPFDGCAGDAGVVVARAGRTARAALRRAGATRRRRQRQRFDLPHHARIQRGDRATGAAPSRAMVVGPPPLEVGAPQAATHRSARRANRRGRPTYKVAVIPASARGLAKPRRMIRSRGPTPAPTRLQPQHEESSCRYRCIKPA